MIAMGSVTAELSLMAGGPVISSAVDLGGSLVWDWLGFIPSLVFSRSDTNEASIDCPAGCFGDWELSQN